MLFTDNIVKLISKKLLGEASKTELLQLSVLLEKHPELKKAEHDLCEWWTLDENQVTYSDNAVLFHRIRKRIENEGGE